MAIAAVRKRKNNVKIPLHKLQCEIVGYLCINCNVRLLAVAILGEMFQMISQYGDGGLV
jgi:predicted transcriptional regulator YheO